MSGPEPEKTTGPGGEAPEAIVERHWGAVHRLMFRMAGNDTDADDLTQEAFLRAFGRLDSYQPGTNVRAWLMRIATNAFFDLQRKRKTARAGIMSCRTIANPE